MIESPSKRASFDTDREHLGRVYAQGLIDAAEGQQVADRVMEELDSLVDDVLDALPDFEELLASPRIGVNEKKRILDNAFADRMAPLLLNFLKVLGKRGRLDCLRHIREAAHKLYNDAHNRVEVSVETAAPIEQKLMCQVEQQLTMTLGRQVVLYSRVNPELLGGLVVHIGDTMYDGSLDRRLETMRQNTKEQTARQIRASLQRFVVPDGQ